MQKATNRKPPKIEKASSTQRTSQAVPHPSTDRALQRLTSEFGRDLVYSLRYGRWRTLWNRVDWLGKVESQLSVKNRVPLGPGDRKKIRRSTELQELDRSPIAFQNREEQIVATREKSQWIVAQRLLSHLQYPDSTKSSAKDLSFPHVNL